MKDFQLGWPPALLNIDAPSEYVLSGRTPARIRLTPAQEALRKMKDDMTSSHGKLEYVSEGSRTGRMAPSQPSPVSEWRSKLPLISCRWYIASPRGDASGARYLHANGLWSRLYRFKAGNWVALKNAQSFYYNGSMGPVRWLRQATEADFGFDPYAE